MPTEIPNLFEHTRVEIPNCKFLISPSAISSFFSYPSTWFKENVKKETQFFGNTSTTIGTLVHYICERVANDKPVNKADMDYTLERFCTRNVNPDIDIEEVIETYPKVAECVVNDYVLPNKQLGIEKFATEKSVYTEIKDGVFVGGTIDRLENDIIVDFKTSNKKPDTALLPFNYKIQLMAYAYCLKHNPKYKWPDINRIRIVYAIKPTVKLPARTFVVTEQISNDYWELITDVLNLIADTVIKARKNPELIYLLFKDYKLKDDVL